MFHVPRPHIYIYYIYIHAYVVRGHVTEATTGIPLKVSLAYACRLFTFEFTAEIEQDTDSDWVNICRLGEAQITKSDVYENTTF